MEIHNNNVQVQEQDQSQTQTQSQEIVRRHWTSNIKAPIYFEYREKVYRLDADFCVFDVDAQNDFKVCNYYGCFTIHDRFDDVYLGYIEFIPIIFKDYTIQEKLPNNIENYFRNIIFKQLTWD